MQTTSGLPRRPVTPEDYDLQALLSIFKKNHRTTLDYGDLRHKLVDDFPRMTNDRQNDLIDYLVEKDIVEKVGYGKWRLIAVRESEKQATPPPPAPTHEPTPAANEPTPAEEPGRGRKIEPGSFRSLMLDYIAENPGKTATQIAAFFEVNPNRISAALAVMFQERRVRRALTVPAKPRGRGGKTREFIYYPVTDTRGELAVKAPAAPAAARATPTPNVTESAADRIFADIEEHPGTTLQAITERLHSGYTYIAKVVRKLVDDGDVRRGERQDGLQTFYAVDDEEPRTRATQAEAKREVPLGDRLVTFVREHPFATAMTVAREFSMSEERATNYLNATYMNNRLRRVRLDQGGGRWIWQYIVPEHPAARTAAGTPPPAPPLTTVRPANPLPSTPFPLPARTAPPAPDPAPAPAPAAPRPKRGSILGAITYTIEVQLDPTDAQQIAALRALEEACECKTINVKA